ncbi:MAG: DUF4446 family protein [Lachnospiraceae bacterium]|nr:DUF4446 family protein [Lachnospiraceae bacterium]
MTYENSILNQMGLGNTDPGIWVILTFVSLVLLLILLIVIAVNSSKISKMKKRLDALTKGSSGDSLEKEIRDIIRENEEIKKDVEQNRKDIEIIYGKVKGAYQKMGLVRYNAFTQMGGALSFCLVLLDEKNDGFVINSVHSTDGCYTYSKEIRDGKCNIDLGDEEKEALSIAMGV